MHRKTSTSKATAKRPRRLKRPAVHQSPAKSQEAEATGQQPLTADLVQLAGQIPAEILQQLVRSIQSGKWLFAVWHIADGKIQMQRTATDFPIIDLDPAVKLLADDLKQL